MSADLSPREKQLIALLADGYKNRDIGVRMGTSEHVVKNYLRTIYDKLGMWNRVELALWHVARQFEDAIKEPPTLAQPSLLP